MSNHASFRWMILFDWHDGPASGIVVNPELKGLFYFYLVDWDSEHRVRVFALHALPSHALESLCQVTQAAPKWPVWFPTELIHPSDEARRWIAAVRDLQIRHDIADYALIWDTATERPIGIRPLSENEGRQAVSWFDAVESEESPFDWFVRLDLPRESKQGE